LRKAPDRTQNKEERDLYNKNCRIGGYGTANLRGGLAANPTETGRDRRGSKNFLVTLALRTESSEVLEKRGEVEVLSKKSLKRGTKKVAREKFEKLREKRIFYLCFSGGGSTKEKRMGRNWII